MGLAWTGPEGKEVLILNLSVSQGPSQRQGVVEPPPPLTTPYASKSDHSDFNVVMILLCIPVLCVIMCPVNSLRDGTQFFSCFFIASHLCWKLSFSSVLSSPAKQ